MNCPSCTHENRPGAKFCEECAAPLKRVCASCGSELRPAAKFCDECATPVAGNAPAARPPVQPSPATPDGARKVVTIVFADLVGSTALHERLDPESARRFMESYYAAARHAVESHGGKVTQLLGDGVKAVFGIPQVAEDDALRAVRAAVAMQEAFQALAEQQRGAVGATGLRVAVNTGEVVAKGETEVIGDPVNVAARLQEQGRDGDVVVGESTHQLVDVRITLELLGSFTLKGRTEAVRAYRVVSLDAPAGAAAAAFVGRDEELARITKIYDRAVNERATSLAVLVGSPGLGKSRLIGEFTRLSEAGATVVTAHCDAAGGATFAPLAEALREHLSLEARAPAETVQAAVEAALTGDDAERKRIASGIAGLLTGSPAAPEETFFVIRRLFAGLAATRPVVLVIDDLQWAEPLLLDLVEHLVEWGSGVQLLVLVGARPELRDVRSTLVMQGGLVADVVTLGGLDAGAATRLAANVVGAVDLPTAVAAKVLATSEGNPLFIGELVRMLVHEGALTREGDRWIIGTALATLEMPPTIHALLAARIERLPPEERAVLERAAVVGRQFSRSAVAELLPQNATDLDSRLQSLQRSELIERDTGWLLGEPVLRFHHVLIRDAAYRRILKGTRAELHGRLADWMEGRVGDAVEHDETIGRHLEQAHQLLGELGPLDAAGRTLGDRASTRLAAAGRAALAGDDVPLAANLLGRALDRLDRDDATRADLALDWCEALLAAGDVGPAAAAIDELGRFTADSERLQAWHTCFAGQHTVMTAPEALDATAEAVAAAATSLAAQDDAAGEAKAHFVYALALSRLGKVGACEAALDQALAAARRAGDRRRANTVLAIAPLAALWGPSPVTRASGRCLDVVRVLRITQGAPAVEAVALSCQGVLEALRGRTDAARRMIASARKMVEELGITQRLLETDVFAGLVALLEGDAAAAERSLRGAYDGLRELGLGINAAQAAALLARALLAQDRAAEAEALSHESEELAGDDLKAAIAWRSVRAEALARRGEHAAAVELAQKGVEIAAATDALLDHADARLALAAALRAAGRSREADAEERRASELWETKGATLLGEQAARERARVAPAAAPTEPRATPPTAPTAPSPPTAQRRLRPNAATATLAPAARAWSARDLDAYRALFSDDFEEIYHPTGSSYGVDETLAGVRDLLETRHPSTSADPLATLGPSLMLTRRRSGAHGVAQENYDVGEFDIEQIQLLEVDEGSLLRRRSEVFGTEHLGDAIARLYERYGELLPAGPARERAVATAYSVVTFLTGGDMLVGSALAPEVEVVDHRTVGFGTLQGAQRLLDALGALIELSDNNTMLVEDVLALRANVLVHRSTHAGTLRDGGGTFERRLCALLVFGADGRIARYEQWDAEQEAEALARFDTLVEGGQASRSTPPRTPLRRVRPNAATAAQVRQEAALAARDFDAVRASFCDDFHEVDHSTGSTWGADGPVASLQRLYRSRDPSYHIEVLATLGSSLLLGRRRSSASGATSKHYDVGEYENEVVMCLEVDDHGRFQRAESFSTERLGDAVARFYQRYAERLPPGQERDRAAAAGHSVAAMGGVSDLDRFATAFAPSIEAVDHRTVGFGTLQGRQAALEAAGALLDLSEQLTARIDNVLALSADAFVGKGATTGTLRDGGGAFERSLCMLMTFDADGLITRLEQFDGDREADALARFDALAAGATALAPLRRIRANRATAVGGRFAAATDARDAAALDATLADDLVYVHHATGTTFGKPETMKSWGGVLQAEQLESRFEPYATLGESLTLARLRLSIAGIKDDEDLANFGPAEADLFVIAEEVGDRIQRIEQFPAEHLGNAVAKLYERYAEQLADGPTRARAIAVARAWEAGMGTVDAIIELVVSLYAPTLEAIDHRTAGVGTIHGAEAWLEANRALFALTKDASLRIDDVLAICPNANVVKLEQSGVLRDGGGQFERSFWVLTQYDDNGLIARIEQFNPDSEAEALARFDAVTGGAEPPRPRFANAAQHRLQQLMGGWEARDWHSVEQSLAPAFRFADHRRLNQLDLDREHFLEQFRILFDQPGSRFDASMLATRGEQLMLARVTYRARVEHGGPLEIPYLVLWEYDAEGRSIGGASFDLENEGAAYAELDTRYEAGEAAAAGQNWANIRSFVHGVAANDWNALAALCAESFVEYDHRSLATLGTTHGGTAWAENFRTLAEVSGDTAYRVDHFLHAAHGYMTHGGWRGARDGGPYEIPLHAVIELDAQGLIVRADIYDDDGVDAALARFAELNVPASPSEPFANAAARVQQAMLACVRARDWTRTRRYFDPGFRFSDRRRFAQVEIDRDEYVEMIRAVGDMSSLKIASKTLATRGNRLSLAWTRLEVAEGDVGPSEIEHLNVAETNAEGDALIATVRFDPNNLDAAYAELDARYVAGEGGPHAFFDQGELDSAIASEDWDKLRTLIAPDIVSHDFRRLALLGTVHGIEAYVQSVRGFTDLAPDLSVRREHVRGSGRTFLWQGIIGGTREGGVFELHVVAVVERNEQGRIQRVAWYDIEQLDEAWARFDALTRDPAATAAAPPSRRVRENAATRNAERERAAVAARDVDTLTAVFAEDLEVIYHPTGSTYGRAGVVETWRELFQARDLRYDHTALGTLGETLALMRVSAAHDGSERSYVGSVGPVEASLLHVVEVDAQERMTRSEVFADNRLSDAIACLYDRYAERLPHGPGRECALATARALRGTQQPTELIHSPHVLTDDIEMIDHRVLGTWTARGADAVRRNMGAIEEVADNPVLRDDDVLALMPNALLVRRTHSGTERVGGGAYERPFIGLMVFGADGLVRQWELFDVDHEAEALARFDELAGGGQAAPAPAQIERARFAEVQAGALAAGSPTQWFANAATRMNERAMVVIATGDWNTFKTLVVPDWRNIDRRGHIQLELDLDQWRTAYREIFEMTTGVPTSKILATRGERLALCSTVWQGEGGDIGPSEIEVLGLHEVDAHGRSTLSVTFDPDDLDAAHADLEARWEAGEGGPLVGIFRIYADAIANQDWDALRAVTAPDFVSRDARSLAVLGTQRSVEAHVQAVRALAELAPDMTLRLEHVRRRARTFLWQGTCRGTQAGSAFEFHVVGVDEHDEQGRTTCRTWYDVEQLDAARARFDELTAAPSSPRPRARPNAASTDPAPASASPTRRVRPNAATRNCERQTAAIAARDADAFAATLSEQLQITHHPTGSTYGASERVKTWRAFFRTTRLRCDLTPLATLGDSLALVVGSICHEGTELRGIASVGPVEVESIAIVEVDEHGLQRRGEHFADNRLGDAVDRLYARYAEQLPAGPARERAEATARTVHKTRDAHYLRLLPEVLAPDVECVDHRVLGTWNARGLGAMQQHVRSLPEVAEDIVFRVDDVLGSATETLLERWTHIGTGRAGGGTYERPFLLLQVFGADGRVTRWEWFDVDHEAEALARFDALMGYGKQTPALDRFANIVTRTIDRATAAFAARDWESWSASFATDFWHSDRRTHVQLDADREEWLASWREIIEMSSERPACEVLATRGERLALFHWLWRGAKGDIGPSELEWLMVVETNERGEHTAVVAFDSDARDAAYAELDARWMAEHGEGHGSLPVETIHNFNAAVARRDWTAAAECCGPGLHVNDHRLLGWGTTLEDTATLVEAQQALVELAPDTRYRTDHIRVSGHAAIHQAAQVGTREGGAFETPFLSVGSYGNGRLQEMDVYDIEQLDQAWTRFDAIAATPPTASPPERFANIATRAIDRGTAAIAVRDWEGWAALFAADFRHFDRRSLMRLDTGRDEWLTSFRRIVEMSSDRPTYETLATRGDRLALFHMLWRGAEGDVGPSEIEWLLVVEQNQRDEHAAIVTFDPGDLDTAYAELDARWRAGEATAYAPVAAWSRNFQTALEGRAWDTLGSGIAPDCIAQDHRLVSWGTLHGRDFTRSLQAMTELAPDARGRTDHTRFAKGGFLAETVWTGTRDGGAFESPFVFVCELDAHGLAKRLDFYDPHHLDRALARFDEIDADTPPDPLAVIEKPNAASLCFQRWATRFRAFVTAADSESLRQFATPDMVFEDRQRRALVSGGVDLMVASSRERILAGARPTLHQVGTAGDRVAIHRVLWSGGPDDGRFEIEYFGISEVDGTGRLSAFILMDIDDPLAAQREAWRRWAAIDPVAAPWIALISPGDPSDQNVDDYRATFTEDLVVEDRRRTGVGRIEGLDAYFESVNVFWELAPDTRVEMAWYWPAYDRHAALTTLRRVGTVPDGGGAYESVYLVLFALGADGRINRQELFEPDSLDAALARFEELRPAAPAAQNGLATPTPADPFAALAKPNAATRALDRWQATFEAGVDTGDWDAMLRLCAPGMVFEDRQRRALVNGGAELMVASARERALLGARPERGEIGTAGDRVAIGRSLWAGGPADGRFEVEFFTVTEVDETGLITAMLLMDLDDPVAAQREAWQRWAALDPVAAPWVALLLAGGFSGTPKFEEYRASFTEDLVVEDRRRTGVGRIDGRDAYLESVKVLWELAPDTQFEMGRYWPAYDRHAAITTLRRSGTVADGGAYEVPYLVLMVLGPDGRIAFMELFEPEALNQALARFEELRPDERHPAAQPDPLAAIAKPNTASEWLHRLQPTLDTGDWNAVRALFASGAIYEDRQRQALLAGDLEMLLASLRERTEAGTRIERIRLLGTAGERVAVSELLWAVGGPDDRSEIEFIIVQEVDEHGRLVATINFDLDNRHDAQREAWARWARIEPGTAQWTERLATITDVFNSHDSSQIRAIYADDVVVEDNQRTGIGHLKGSNVYAQAIAVFWELAPDTQIEIGWHWPAYDRHAALTTVRRSGTIPDGGPFESDYLTLVVLRDGRITRQEMFELDQLDTALARFEELRPDPLRIPPNAATRNRDRACEYAAAGNWDGLRALYAPAVHYEDRRPMLRSVGDKDSAVADLRYLFGEAKAQVERTLVATGGERIAIEHWVWTAADPEQQFELDALALVEVDAAGLVTTVILFHPDDRAAASAEMMQRWTTYEVDPLPAAAVAQVAAWNDHDLDRLRTVLHDDYYFDDRRRTGLGLVDRNTYLNSLTALFQLSPDVQLELLYTISMTKQTSLHVNRWYGTNTEGGDFESIFVALVRADGERLVGIELFEIDDLDTARARIDELEVQTPRLAPQQQPRSPTDLPPNAATQASKQLYRSVMARDWNAVHRSAATGFVFEDRSKHALIRGDVDSWIASIKFTREELPGVQMEGRREATIGERIALETLIWSGSPDGEAYEFDRLRLLEVDADGHVQAVILFDRDDRAAATIEALQRFAAGEAAGIGWEGTMLAFYHAWLERDWHAQEATWTPDLVFQDHRRLGLGTYTAAELIDSLRSLETLAPDVRLDLIRIVHWNRHGWVSRNCAAGTFPGGGPFEQPFLDVILYDGQQTRRIESFDIEDLDRALARFEELCAERTD